MDRWRPERDGRPAWRTGLGIGVILALLSTGPAHTRASDRRCPDSGPMLVVPGGPFWRGSGAAERQLARELSSPAMREARWFDAELPRRRAAAPTFCVDRTPVTQAQYADVVSANGHRIPAISREDYQRQGSSYTTTIAK